MYNTLKTYTPPRVLQEMEIALERDLLGGSVVENLNEAGVLTMGQEVEEMDFETEEFNFKWE